MSFWKDVGAALVVAGASIAAVALLPVEAAAVAVGVTVLGVVAAAAAFSGEDGDEPTEAARRKEAKAAEEAKRARDAMEKALDKLRPYKQREGLQLAIFGALVGALNDAGAVRDTTFADARSYCFGEFPADDRSDLTKKQDRIRANPPGLVQAAKQLAGFPLVPWTEISDVIRVLLDSAAAEHNKFASVLAAWDLASRPHRPNQDVVAAWA